MFSTWPHRSCTLRSHWSGEELQMIFLDSKESFFFLHKLVIREVKCRCVRTGRADRSFRLDQRRRGGDGGAMLRRCVIRPHPCLNLNDSWHLKQKEATLWYVAGTVLEYLLILLLKHFEQWKNTEELQHAGWRRRKLQSVSEEIPSIHMKCSCFKGNTLKRQTVSVFDGTICSQHPSNHTR